MWRQQGELHLQAAQGHALIGQALVQLAELDVLKSEGGLFASKLQIAGVRVAEITYEGMLHGFMRYTEVVGKAREAVAHAGEWLKEVGGMLPPDEQQGGTF